MIMKKVHWPNRCCNRSARSLLLRVGVVCLAGYRVNIALLTESMWFVMHYIRSPSICHSNTQVQADVSDISTQLIFVVH